MRQCAVGFDGAEGGLIAGSDGVVVEERHEVGVRLAVADHPIELRQGPMQAGLVLPNLLWSATRIFAAPSPWRDASSPARRS